MINKKIIIQGATLTTYVLDQIEAAEGRKRPAIIVAPGGGYRMCSEREREAIAMKFLSMGYHAFTLDYSVAPNRFPTALHELALAVATVREQEAVWGVDPDKILICGFSAGGHLVGSLATLWDKPIAYAEIGKAPEEIKPNGVIFGYPVITSGEYCHAGSFENLLGEKKDDVELRKSVSLELQVTEKMPPAFIWHTATDPLVPVENSFLLASAMKKAQVPFELHIFPKGGHGLALATKETAGENAAHVEPCCQSWISLLQLWVENNF